jgi:hypothetical protein
MSTEILRRRFARIGARLEVEEGPWLGSPLIDVRRDRRGEYFDIRFAGGDREVALEVVDALRDERHLLLLVRDGEEKSKFLCGHDERHWFVAAIPEDARGVSGVFAAMDVLQPAGVRDAIRRVRPRDRFKRRNAAFVRQGEWFFVPEPTLEVRPADVLRDEPITRGRGQAHVLEYAYRRGGEVVYVSPRYPRGISQSAFDALSERSRRQWDWETLVRDAEVYAKGTVRHPDHNTIMLHGWHRVLMNTEQRARAMRHVVFLD